MTTPVTTSVRGLSIALKHLLLPQRPAPVRRGRKGSSRSDVAAARRKAGRAATDLSQGTAQPAPSTENGQTAGHGSRSRDALSSPRLLFRWGRAACDPGAPQSHTGNRPLSGPYLGSDLVSALPGLDVHDLTHGAGVRCCSVITPPSGRSRTLHCRGRAPRPPLNRAPRPAPPVTSCGGANGRTVFGRCSGSVSHCWGLRAGAGMGTAAGQREPGPSAVRVRPAWGAGRGSPSAGERERSRSCTRHGACRAEKVENKPKNSNPPNSSLCTCWEFIPLLSLSLLCCSSKACAAVFLAPVKPVFLAQASIIMFWYVLSPRIISPYLRHL